MRGYFIIVGGMFLFATFFVVVDWLNERRERRERRAQKQN